MVWAGEVTNDTLAPLRSLLAGEPSQGRRERIAPAFRSRRPGPPGSEGRWSLLPAPSGTGTERSAALAQVLLARHGVLTREAVHAEGIPGGFASVYEVLKRMEETGRARRGYFVAGLGATQFALPGAEERLRSLREPPDGPQTVILSATDPANPYGAALAWPGRGEGAPESRPQRAARSAGPGRRCARRSARRRRALSEPESDAREHALDDAIAAGAVEGKRRQRGRADAGEELVAHGRAGAMQPRLHRHLGDAERVGDLRGGKSLDVAEDEHRTVSHGEGVDGRGEDAA